MAAPLSSSLIGLGLPAPLAQAFTDNAVQMVAAPASATAAGTINQVAYDATHFYVCISTNVWVRGTLATW